MTDATRAEKPLLAPAIRRIARAASSVVDRWYRARNRGRPRLLIYTDSRGFNVIGNLGRTPFGTYVGPLRAKYDVTHCISPEHPTTIVDFLNLLDTVTTSDYDAIVLHCGIVDFSPRPLSSLASLRAMKTGAPRFKSLFEANEEHYHRPFAHAYHGEPTVSLYSHDFLVRDVLPSLQALQHLIWINSNRFVPDWDGNYTKGRPLDIDAAVSDCDRIMMQHLLHVVDLKKWSAADVQTYTIDNIHYTPTGFGQLARLIDEAVQDLVSSRLSQHALGGTTPRTQPGHADLRL